MISIQKLSKYFVVFTSRMGALRYLLGMGKKGRDYRHVYSLSDIELEIPEGSVHGIIGLNGAGKSTLLKILTGVIDASEGKAVVKGKLASLLELGTGFHRELTGRENIFVNGAIHGYSRDEILERLPSMEEFAEIGAYFDQPVKTYSSGMYVRLAFSFAIHIDPEILIIDEALSVGDVYFQQKCLDKIYEFKDKNTTILFVSHDLGAVKRLCDQVTVLHHGKISYSGDPVQAMDRYNQLVAEVKRPVKDIAPRVSAGIGSESGSAGGNGTQIQPDDLAAAFQNGNGKMRVNAIDLLDKNGKASDVFVSGDSIQVIIRATVFQEGLLRPTCGILLRDRLGYDVFGTNTASMNLLPDPLGQGQKVVFTFSFDLNLGPGNYFLTVALHSQSSHINDNYHWLDRVKAMQVLPATDLEMIGVARLMPTVSAEVIP